MELVHRIIIQRLQWLGHVVRIKEEERECDSLLFGTFILKLFVTFLNDNWLLYAKQDMHKLELAW